MMKPSATLLAMLLTGALLFGDEPVSPSLQTARELLREGKRAEARKVIDAVITVDSKSKEALNFRAQLCLATQQPEQAVADFTSLIALDPKTPKLLDMRG